jgi:phosphoglycerate dehydrogenase-like enzyme
MGAISRRGLIGAAGAAALGTVVDRSSAKTQATADAPRLPLNVLLRAGLSEGHQKRVREISPRITLGKEVALGDADVILGYVSDAELAQAKKLRWVHCQSAGVEHYPLGAMEERGIILTNAQGCYGPQIAEHVFALLLALTRGVGALSRKRQWGFDGEPIELRGMTMGIIGLGGIGRETARRAKAMDMKVLAVDAEPIYGEKFACVDECRLVDDGLEELLRRSDVVVVAAPHTPRSRGMLAAAQFTVMKDGSYLINVSRGKLVKTDDLLAALRSGKLSGVGLDVTDPEPLPPDHPLWQEDRAIITSHIAGKSQLGYQRVQEVFVENLSRFVTGRPLLNLVDKAKGY